MKRRCCLKTIDSPTLNGILNAFLDIEEISKGKTTENREPMTAASLKKVFEDTYNKIPSDKYILLNAENHDTVSDIAERRSEVGLGENASEAIIRLYRYNDAICYGNLEWYNGNCDEIVFAYIRSFNEEKVLILINMYSKIKSAETPDFCTGDVILSRNIRQHMENKVLLDAYGVIAVKI